MRQLASGLAIASAILFTAISAAAEPPLERELLRETGKAVEKFIFEGPAAAIAVCEDARKLIVPGSPAYLNFYIERCLATVSEPGGVRGGARCPHYRSVIAIWQASPPPIDPNEEDAAITDARYLRNAKQEVAEYCTPGAVAPPPYDPEAMLIQPISGGILETQEGLAYALPPGYGVQTFDPNSGLATLRDPATDFILSVSRKGLNDAFTRTLEYPEQEKMASGAVLAWEYKEIIPGWGSVLYGLVTLPNAYVVLGASTGARSGATSMDKTAGLEAFRTIAATVRVTGARRCIGECGPPVILQPQ